MQVCVLNDSLDCADVLKFVGTIAGVCTDRQNINNEARAIRCAKQGHWSIFEHVSMTWEIRGISRACSHQLVRHRMASYTQKSQRYTNPDTQSEWFVVPEDCPNPKRFGGMMHTLGVMYEELIQMGMKPEDARYILPNAAKTDIYVTMNLREFFHFYKERGANPHAQWEIREMANKMKDSLIFNHPELQTIIDIVK